MRLRWLPILLVTALLIAVSPLQTVQAARGLPGSADFGFGARINLNGAQFEQALQQVGALRLDWLTIDLSWATIMPDPTATIDFTRLDQAMNIAAQNQTAVLISLTQAPAWALTGQGPNPNLAAVVIQILAARYPGTLQAVELFPGANTLAGWGAAPDPASYWNLFSTVRAKLQESGTTLEWVAAGLEITGPQPANAIGELDFLRDLYQAGGANGLPIISLRYSTVTGQPSDAALENETRMLRRYETIRQVIVEYNQGNSLLWITRLSVPDGTINAGEITGKDPAQQSTWLSHAAGQLRAQLYIGMVVFADLNATDATQPYYQGANLAAGNHPFTRALREIIQQNEPADMSTTPGRAKSDGFTKIRP